MRFNTVSSPHTRGSNTVANTMLQVMIALIPGTVAMIFYFGVGVLLNILVAMFFAVLSETVMLRLRKRPVLPTLQDNSAILTAWLLALALPPLAPWWLTAIGISFAIIFAKHCYGGLGHNLFNPAMAGYAVLIVSFPVYMTQWLTPGSLLSAVSFSDAVNVIFLSGTPDAGWDAISSATPLDTMKTQLGLNNTMEEIKQNPLFGDFGGHGWEWIGNWYLIGGVYLLFRRTITWHTPVALLLGLGAIATFFYMVDPDNHPSAGFHIFSGGAMLAAFFIATDPVTACTSNKGKLVYGACIGILIYIIRTWGGYPDGVAFAVLLMNMAAPYIDYYTKPRVYGHRKS